MEAEHAKELLSRLGCRRIRQNASGWVNSSCPFAPFTALHKNHADKNPSFGIRAEDGKSTYRCFTCNARGSITDLLMRLRVLMAKEGHDVSDFSTLFRWVQERDKEVLPSLDALSAALDAADYKEPTGPMEIGGIRLSAKAVRAVFGRSAPAPDTVLDEKTLENFAELPDEALIYLQQVRKMPLQAIREWDFRWHPPTRRIAIPIRDFRGRLVGVSGRSLFGEQKRKFLHSEGFQRDRFLYGESRLKEGGTGCGVVVEGFFDAIHLWQHGYPAVAILGTYLSSVQLEKMARFFGSAVVLTDGDAAGIEAAGHMAALLGRRMQTRVAEIPRGKDPDDLSPLELASLLKVDPPASEIPEVRVT